MWQAFCGKLFLYVTPVRGVCGKLSLKASNEKACHNFDSKRSLPHPKRDTKSYHTPLRGGWHTESCTGWHTEPIAGRVAHGNVDDGGGIRNDCLKIELIFRVTVDIFIHCHTERVS